jgi:hypothetical protein
MLTDRGTTSSQHSHPSPPKLHGQTHPTIVPIGCPDCDLQSHIADLHDQTEHLQHSDDVKLLQALLSTVPR